MPAGFPAYPASSFPNEKPPTLFHPSSPKSPKATPVSYSTSKSYTATSSSSSKDSTETTAKYTPANDTSSLYSTTSTISLLKHPFSTLKTKFSHKERSKKELAKPSEKTRTFDPKA
ncbi:hypothetical protein BCIN_02g04720 [Botrytis cinerea B05.10]|uniref:Uncharacterized protein n=3 Tax=Botryotinia fuckeliana TaxID=40559 RepID=A0A384J9N2_BOTFB|nr:hypothetical protein BCIN_02g04720 [Botrytis cinerea B05.10]ATZ47161.1 hypothetical protein BCIN_02g04720 [Botrytis cinerea B05.10]EMR86605.1 hypothetical protein BcDW1_4756 [Botrytis cinerea BcDW1]CCD53312.1 hypothetical protein BofuT4_P123310.1 [Botrytis cinerea T4]